MQPKTAIPLPFVPHTGYVVNAERMTVAAESGRRLASTTDDLRERRELRTLGYPATGNDVAFLVVYPPRGTATGLGILMHPVNDSTVPSPAATRLGSALARLAADGPFDERTFAETAIALRLVDGAAGPQQWPVRPRGGLSIRQQAEALAYMNGRAGQAIVVGDIARACGLSESHFARAFKNSHGVPPREWFIRRRVERAKSLLTGSSLGLVDIALACGFCEQSHFTRQFSKLVGVPPGAWRRVARSLNA